jgi:hypothetical protein
MDPSSFLGDVFEACKLVSKITRLLLEHRKKLEDYEELLGELRFMDRLLRNIKRVYGSTAATLPSSDDDITFELIDQEVAACEHVMSNFLEKNKAPTTWWRKAKWMFLASSRAASLRRKLAVHRQNLDLLLIQYVSQPLQSYRVAKAETSRRFNSMETRTLKPQMQNLSFIYAVGIHVPISFIFCRTYTVFT